MLRWLATAEGDGSLLPVATQNTTVDLRPPQEKASICVPLTGPTNLSARSPPHSLTALPPLWQPHESE